MIKFENVETLGWEHAIRGMRNPMNSWEKSDSEYCHGASETCDMCYKAPNDPYAPCYLAESSIGRTYVVGLNDFVLMKCLRNAGTDHRKFMRMITVYADITAPLYWWKEFDTYKVGTVANSCSTMHKIAEKEFTLEDFSYEHLLGYDDLNWGDTVPLVVLGYTISALNTYRQKYLESNDKLYWWQMIQLLPSSYNQKRTVMLNYEVLANIYKSRRTHKLDEWRDFCVWVETLPYSEIIADSTKPKEN